MKEEAALKLFKCLGDKSRLQILKILAKEEMYVELLSKKLDLTPATVSFHLKKLEDAGAVSSRKEQYYTIYTINKNVFMIILWSNDYLQSPACLNEMGAAWVVQSDYTNIYVPDFDFGNPKYRECAVDTNKMGAVLNGNQNCRVSMLELKDKIEAIFSLKNDEKKVSVLLDDFLENIK